MRKLDIYKQAKEELESLQKSDKKLLSQIIVEIENLEQNPLPPNSKKLAGYKNLYRIRVRKYRIIYKFDEKILSILLIDGRGNIYKNL